MPKFLKFVICLGIEIACIVIGFLVGGWWPIRNVPADQMWAGDGVGIMIYGLGGAAIGAVIGFAGIEVFLLRVRRHSRRSVRQADTGGEEVWPPPPGTPAV